MPSILKGVQLSGHDVVATSTTRLHPLGTPGEAEDGRLYRYCSANSAIAAGLLAQAQAETANHRNIAVAAAAAIGATAVTVTLGGTAATADQYESGYLVASDGAGEGIAYKIQGHPAADANAALVVTLAEPLQVALTVASEVTLIASPYRLVDDVASQARKAVGVPNVAVAASAYFWAQTRGVCSVQGGDTSTMGQVLTQDAAVAGQLEARDADTEQAIAVAMSTLVVGEHFPVYLIIE